MRDQRARKTIGIASAFAAVLLAGTVAWLLNKPATSDCGGEAPVNHKVDEIRATKVVVQPWLGQHRVYGIFTVPDRYMNKKNYAVTMTVFGFDHHFAVTGGADKQYMDHLFAPPGHYLLRNYIPTRAALWILLIGQFGDLRVPCNWSLEFVKRAS